MNKRIRQLVEQATDTVEIVNPDTGITHHREFFDKEKFAELIVRECANIVANRKDQAIDNGLNVDEAMSMAEMDLLEHFGVEE